MKLVLDEWIIREVIDTLYMAQTTLLGITGLDSPQEVAKKCANETAITRRISKAIDIIQQSEQPEVDLITEYDEQFDSDPVYRQLVNRSAGIAIARHFWNKGYNARKEE